MKEQSKQLSEETKMNIIKFLLKTSVPRIIAERQKESKEA